MLGVLRKWETKTRFLRFYVHRSLGRRRGKDSFLNGNNSQFIESMYNDWLKDPKSVGESWSNYFESTGSPEKTTGKMDEKKSAAPSSMPSAAMTETRGSPVEVTGQGLDIDATIRAYQSRGHLVADIDPLGIQNPDSAKLQGTAQLPPTVVVRQHLKGLTDADLNREFPLSRSLTVLGGEKRSLPLKDILTRLNKIYCGHLGLEYTFIPDFEQLDWLRHKFEVPGAWELQPDHRKWIWTNVMKAVTFEGYLAKKYGTEKRFGLEGCEAFIPAMVQCFETSAELGVDSAIIGMAHRGRLNTLINVCGKPMHQLFTQFNPIPMEGLGSGDVKYHLGTHAERLMERSGKKMRIAMLGNPSHLEAVAPSVVGRVRAEMIARDDLKSDKSLAVIVHGDAAYAGQGVCYETMHLTNLPDYTTGGVIHVVTNNQIGFTTDPRYSRSSAHCTDVARVVNAPILHIHADDPDLVAYCSQVAAEYRSVYHNDVVLDVVGYRRNGHNEMDEPMLTQPLMYKRIKAHPNVLTIYSERLIKDGVIDEAFVKQETEKFQQLCESEFKKAQTIETMQMKDWHDVPWTEFFANQSPTNKIGETGMDKDTIKKICEAFSSRPEDIEPHSQVFRVLDRRKKLMQARQFDWAMAEALAFASLLKEGHPVRLSGEDVERGTFSHRIHIVHDQNKDKTWKNVLNGIFPGQALYTVSNSPLSEFGVLGFELGYSSYDHNTLTIWEAQFGDFANSCQVVIDSLLCSGQSKWGRQVGLVLLLPHGMEGQGPEHSSARLERFLQLCDDDCTHIPGDATESPDDIMTRQLFEINWIVCNLTTPANLCHALRRQIHMPFRKPLVIMTPKSLLRHPMAQSSLDDIETGTKFSPIYPDKTQQPDKIKKVLVCSGKVYYDLVAERMEKKLEEQIAIIRIEQICPFPYNLFAKEISRFTNAKIMWFQEEHKNQGAYHYIRDRLATALKLPLEEIRYGGRPVSSAPATGSKVIFKEELHSMMETAMSLD